MALMPRESRVRITTAERMASTAAITAKPATRDTVKAAPAPQEEGKAHPVTGRHQELQKHHGRAAHEHAHQLLGHRRLNHHPQGSTGRHRS